MTTCDKIREFRELCGLTKKEVKTLGKFNGSEQFYGQCENGKYELGEEVIHEMYMAICRARAVKLEQKKNQNK